MRPRWSRIGCALLVALGVLGFSTSVAATAESGTNAPTGPTIVGGPLAR